ncbi:peptide ABC transporter substrate-binding protein [Actinoplanes derwentensis]|uniref:Oligopeptide transport system substrate-binding protein n=1 Tax=Actinoplanes derwentensis TaxID=113562 RepID=A0A1H2CKC0_9ACTN|nr:ABC transporter substrate-binding protein [Actinoplanes derwentensis]GID82659.1 peptide ABC transporter substrate-binding protein [Actinoplanes derwentensis]SDT70871.1 oligopeptide transport system substrate-binding protein [Actinoplanes derwentensis]
MLGKRPWKLAAGLAAFSLLIAGCGGGDSDDEAANSNTVVIGLSEPSDLLPTNVTDVNGTTVLSSLFYPLVEFNSRKEPVEVAAESIKPSVNNRVWTIKLKPGFTFHNGEPVTAQNYIDSWNYGAYGPNAQTGSFFFERIAGYAALNPEDPDKDGPLKAEIPKTNKLTGLVKKDDLTFQVTLSAPFSSFKTVLAYSVFYPLPKAAFASDGVIVEGFSEQVIGNGPFKMKGKWEHDNQIVVEKVADFKGKVPKIDGVTWKIYQDEQTEYADLVTGSLDVQTSIPIEALSSAPADLGERFQRSENSGFDVLGFPVYDSTWSNKDVRKAISMAINRDEIANQIFLGSRSPAHSFVSPVVAGFREDSCGEACQYSPAKAKTLYKQGRGPSEIKITYNVDGGHKAWVDATCNQITAALGVTCVGNPVAKFADLQAMARAKEPIGMFRLSWSMDYPLMENYLGPLYSSNGSSNFSGFSDARFDALVKQGSAASTPAAAIKKWQQAEDILVDEMPFIPLRFSNNVYGYSERVQNVEIDLFMKVNLYEIETIA